MPTAAENKLAKRNRILDSAFNLFMGQSFAATAIDDVVKMAGVAKGTFYLYFRDKYDLLDQILVHKSAALLKDAIGAVDAKDADKKMTLYEKSLFMSEYICTFLESNRNFTALLDKKLSYCIRAFFSSETDDYSAIASRLISGFTGAGCDEKQAKIKIYLLTDTIGSVMCDSILGGVPFSPNEIKPELKKVIRQITEV